MEGLLYAAAPARDEADRDADDALLCAAASGYDAALATLYDRFARELFGLALWRTGSREAAEDAVQELFCRIASGAASPPGRVRSLRAWLLTLVRRIAVDHRRESAREDRLEDALERVAAPFEALESRADAARALAALPPKLREALFLRYWAGLTFREIASIVRVPTFTAASRCRLALVRLRRELGAPPG